jgi:hypothetical protein
MKQSVNFYAFRDAFRSHGREEQFTHDGLCALFDYLEELEADIGMEFELDVVALCCGYQEYKDLADYNEQYGTDHEDIDAIRDDCQVIEIDNESFICSEH